ncbi:MAG: hypothetical protein ACJA0M_002379 [Chitinophagales bacterium]|jgi:hypothetical protein
MKTRIINHLDNEPCCSLVNGLALPSNNLVIRNKAANNINKMKSKSPIVHLDEAINGLSNRFG